MIEAPELSEHWMVAIGTPSESFGSRSLKALQKDLLELRPELEARGSTRFTCSSPGDPERDLCRDYPFVKFGNTCDLEGPPSLWLNYSPVVSFDADDLVAVAEARAELPDNRAKLARSELEARHLFVWVNVWELAAAASFAQGGEPRKPRLPGEVTDLWLGRLTDDEVEVWRFGRGSWTSHRIARSDLA